VVVGRSRAPYQPRQGQTRRERKTVAEHLLEVKGAFKHFGAVQALRGANLKADAGSVRALVGDNGAGKTVLTKSISGIYQLDKGEFLWNGERVSINGPKDSARLGIEVVYQDLALSDNLDVVENMYLGRETLSSFRRLDEAKMEAATRKVLRDLSVTTLQSVRLPVAAMSGGQRQSVAVAKAVLWNSKLVVLDEPTAALGVAQTRQVLDLTRRLADQGLGVILISHTMSDVFEVADDITVLRLGQTVAEFKRKETTQREVVEAITAGQLHEVPGMEGVTV
jgi:D-xylose transport system ATP-binding protein